VLNLTGILLNALEVVLIFVFGISPLTRKEGPVYLYTTEEIDNKKSAINKKDSMYKLLSRIGLLLCIIAAVFQMLSCFLPAICGRI
jgi:hypothetical protein